jgi:hypothetical protein
MNKKFLILITILLLLLLNGTVTAAKYSVVTKVLEGEGKIELLPDRRLYNEGEEVLITAKPESNFKGWSYDLEGISSTKKITVDKNMMIGARFAVDPVKESLNNKIKYINDIRIFTLFSFMNYTGYDDENRVFSETRKAVRSELEAMNLDLEDNNYYDNKGVRGYYYVHAIKHLGNPPDFEVVSDGLPSYGGLSALQDLPEHLEEFYQKANIRELYNKYNPIYQEKMSDYEAQVTDVLLEVNNYLKINEEDIFDLYININLLDSHSRGYGAGNKDQFYDAEMIITGPSNGPNMQNIVHEYLHGVITPINNELKSEINKLDYLSANIPEGSQAANYPSWFSVVDESIIRAITPKFAGNYQEHGFVLGDYFRKRFDEFNDFDGSLEEFIEKLLQEYEDYNNL